MIKETWMKQEYSGNSVMRGLFRLLIICVFTSVILSCGGDSGDAVSVGGNSGSVVSPLPANSKISVVNFQFGDGSTDSFAISQPDDSIEPYMAVDDAGNLIYAAMYSSASKSNLEVGSASTAALITYQLLSTIPLDAAQGAELINEINNHKDISTVGSKIEDIVAKIGYFDIDLLTDEYLDLLINIAIDSVESLSAKQLTKVSGSRLMQKSIIGITEPGYEDLITIKKYDFEQIGDEPIKTDLAFENHTYLYYDTSLYLGATLVSELPMMDASNVDGTFGTIKNLIIGAWNGTTSSWIGSNPTENIYSYAVSSDPEEVTTIQFDPRSSRALTMNIVSILLQNMNIKGWLTDQTINAWFKNQVNTYVSSNEQAFSSALQQQNAELVLASLMRLGEDFLTKERLIKFAKKTGMSYKQYAGTKSLIKTAFKFLDVGKHFGSTQQLVQLALYPKQEFLIRPVTTQIAVAGNTVTWSNTFSEPPYQYELQLFNTDTFEFEYFTVQGNINTYSFDNLLPGIKYRISVVAMNEFGNAEMITAGINDVEIEDTSCTGRGFIAEGESLFVNSNGEEWRGHCVNNQLTDYTDSTLEAPHYALLRLSVVINTSNETFNVEHHYSYTDGIDNNISIRKTFDVNGALLEESPYVNGLLHGIQKSFYESGELKSETPYAEGLKQGINKRYYIDGTLSGEFSYIDDLMHGLSISYYSNGFVHIQNSLIDGVRQGVAKIYNDRGVLVWDNIYVDGNLTKALLYDADGSLSVEQTYVDGNLESEIFY